MYTSTNQLPQCLRSLRRLAKPAATPKIKNRIVNHGDVPSQRSKAIPIAAPIAIDAAKVIPSELNPAS